MYHSTTIFNQILAFVPKDRLRRFVGQHQADRYVKKMTVWNQFIVLMYAQATGKDSLREIETGLRTQENFWYHLGINTVSRSSIARANNKRSYKIFENLFYAILEQCREITPKRSFSFDNQTDIPEFVNVTAGKVADITQAKKMSLAIPQGSVLVFDRGYLDFSWWYRLEKQGIFFVTR